MVKFSKIVNREKSARPVKRRKGSVGSDVLTMRGLSIQRRSQGSAEKSRDTGESQAAVEKRKVLYTQLAEYLEMVFSSVQADKPFSLEPGFKILEKIVDTPTPIDALFLKAIHDENSYNLMISPSVNVAIYAIKMAENLGFSKTRQVEIGMVGLLHDIGMAKIPEELIYKQNLTDDEFLIFKERPKCGYDILQVFNKDYTYLAECALQIHERFDGGGYPLGLKADEIHEYAQIIGLVDIYEALIHSRPQREKILHFYAVKEIIKTGKDKFQHRFLKALLNTFSIFPLKSYVRLNSGAIGRVTRTYPNQPMRPRVQIIYDSQSKRVLTQRFLNLPEHSLLYIVDAVSEQELIDLSEASYLVTKPGKSDSEPKETEAEPGEPTKAGYPVEEKPVTQPNQAQPAKSAGTLLKKALLVLAILFILAGVAWQFLAENSMNGNDQGTVEKITRAPEKLNTELPKGKVTQPEKAKPSLETTPKQPVKPEAIVPGKSVVDKADNQVKLAPQAMVRPEAVKKSAPKPTLAKSKAIVTDEDPRQSSSSEKSVSGEIQTKEFGPPEPGRYPYSILLAQHRRLSDVRKSMAFLKAKDLEPFWVKVDLGAVGIWYRVFYGYYADSKTAKAAIGQLKLVGALPKPARYANWVGAFPDRKDLDTRVAELSGLGFSTYVVADGTDIDQLYVGAFYTREGAAGQSASLKSAGIDSIIVER